MRKRTWLCCVLFVCAVLVTAGCGKQAGWNEENGARYYYLENGDPMSGWMEDGGKTFYFSEDGKMCTGFARIDGCTYYFNEDGSRASGWITHEGARYYLRGSGSLVTGWLSLDGQRYYLGEDGAAATGVQKVDGSLYVFDKEGRLTSGWADLGEKWAYGDLNCHPLTGWNALDGTRYYFTENGLLHTGWLEKDGFTYYFYADGTPAQGKVTLEGTDYTFASNGQLVTLVNPWNYVPEGYTVELTDIDKEHQVASIAYADYLEMMSDCEDAGHHPVVCSAYRTQEYQEKLFERKVKSLLDKGYDESGAREEAARSVAVPGTSEHQLGLALDIIDNRNWNLDESQADMPTQKWLMENSWRYGWILRYPNEKSRITGIIYEPWHYRYVGREVAAEIHELGICLEEYIMSLTPSVG